MSAKHPMKRLPSPDEPLHDYHRLPAGPPPESWRASQDVGQDDPGPVRFAYNDDAEMLLRFGWG